ncbi:MAG: alpha/beta hydrolase [Microbacteriaceae bacterium]
MPHLDVPGGRIYYEIDGKVSSPALLLLHAGIANLRMWDPQVIPLARDHFVIRFDTRGYGQTSTEDVPFSDRDDALAVLDHLGVQRATVIGSSRGGKICIDLALAHPDRVAGVVTVGSGPSGFPEVGLTEEEDALLDELDAAFDAEDWPTLADHEVRLWAIGASRDDKLLDPEFVATAHALNRVNIQHADEHPSPIPLEPPAYERVTDIEVPMLATVGEFDLTPTLQQQAYLASTIPNAQGYIFAESAHLPSVELPEEFAQVLGDWLAENGL